MPGRLADIAGRAGVSVATVSRVLNDKAGVAEQTRRAVITAMDYLGYERPEPLQSRAGLIGVIVPELENPVFPRFAQAIESSLARHRYTAVLCTQTVGGVHEDDYVKTLLDHGVAGIIFVSGIHAIEGADSGRYTRLIAAGLPIVLVNGSLPDVDVTCISVDDQAAVDKAVEHLAQLGHTRIGLVMGEPRYQPVIRRRAAFRQAMRRYVDASLHDDTLGEFMQSTAYTVEGGAAATETLVRRGVTGVVCGSDLMAIGALDTARRNGLGVPADISVIGSDDSLLMQYFKPALTTIRQPAEAMAAAAAAALVEQIRGAPPTVSEVFFNPELIVRDTTGPAEPGRDARFLTARHPVGNQS